MTSPIYRQGDSRWSSIKYPRGRYNVGSSGCGCMTVLHCIIENPKYAHYQVKDIVGYMRQFATMGNGTKWVGILKGLKHFGYGSTKQLTANTMKEVWAELDKGNRIGGIRMLKGKRGGVVWTSSGHYLMFQNYKKVGDKHYFWIKDSGGRHNDSATHGWYCYETTMRGMFGPIWTAERQDPPIKHTNGYQRELPTTTIKMGSKGVEVKKWQRFLNWVYGDGTKNGNVLVEDGKFGIKTDAYTGCFQYQNKLSEDSVVGKKTLSKASEYKG